MNQQVWDKLSTNIGWCHFTWNLWTGCSKTSSGCAHCYAETWAKRTGRNIWGEDAERPRTKTWGRVKKFREMARDPEWRNHVGLPDGQRARVFIGSLMDWAEGREDQAPIIAEAWPIIRESTELDFLMLTKRPHRIPELLPADWGDGYPNVWLMTSIESGLSNHKDRETRAPVWRRAEALLSVPAKVHGISYEPAVGPLAGVMGEFGFEGRRIGWVIYGGESGPGWRAEGDPDDPKRWAREMRDACAAHGVPFFHKQSAAFRNETGVELDGEIVHEVPRSRF